MRHNKYRTRSAILLATLLIAVPAFAMDTDDPGTVAPKSVDIEISGEYAKSAEGKETGLSIAATTGILSNLDFGLTLPYTISDPDEGGGESGIGDLEAGLKLRFLEGEGARPALALTAGATIPTGDEEKGFGSGKVDLSAALVAGFGFKPVNIYLNFGYGRLNSADADANERADIFSASAAVEWAVTEPLALNAEFLYESAGADGDDAPLAVTAGAAYTFSDMIALDGGVRIGLSDASPDWGLFATLTVSLGGE